MKFIVDTNILYSYFWKNSLTKEMIMREDLELFSPEYALEEINKYKSDIIKKTKITEDKFIELRFDIAISVKFISIEEYRELLKEALEISPDPNDIDFFALSLKLEIPIWSNDLLLQKQNKVKIFTTKEVLYLIRE